MEGVLGTGGRATGARCEVQRRSLLMTRKFWTLKQVPKQFYSRGCQISMDLVLEKMIEASWVIAVS